MTRNTDLIRAAFGVEPAAPVEPQVPVAPSMVGERSPFERAVARGTDNMQASMYAAGGAVGDLFGADWLSELGEEGVRRNLQEAARSPATIESWDDVDSLATGWTKLVETIGEQVPNLAAMAAGGGVGAVGGRMAAAGAAKSFMQKAAFRRAMKDGFTGPVSEAGLATAKRQVATKIGALTGASAVNYPMQAGEVQLALQERGIDAPGTALLAAVPSTMLDIYGLERMVSTVFKGFDRDMAVSLADQISTAAKERGLLSASGLAAAKLIKEAGKGAGVGIAVEAPTEAVQELIKLAAIKVEDPSFDMFAPENLAQVREAFISGAAVGGVFSGVGRGTSAALGTTSELLNRQPPPQEQSGQDTDEAPSAAIGPSGTVRERPEQILDQIAAYRGGERGPVYMDGAVTDPDVRRVRSESTGLVTTVAGDGKGVYFYTLRDKPKIQAAIAAERAAFEAGDEQGVQAARAQLLGYAETKEQVLARDANPRVRRTLGANGAVVKEELVDDFSAPAAEGQREVPVQQALQERVDPAAAASAWGLDPVDPTTAASLTGQQQPPPPTEADMPPAEAEADMPPADIGVDGWGLDPIDPATAASLTGQQPPPPTEAGMPLSPPEANDWGLDPVDPATAVLLAGRQEQSAPPVGQEQMRAAQRPETAAAPAAQDTPGEVDIDAALEWLEAQGQSAMYQDLIAVQRKIDALTKLRDCARS